MKVYVQYIFQTCIFFHYLFSDEQALPNTINNNSVFVCVCLSVCLCVWKHVHLETLCKSEHDEWHEQC